MIEKNSDCLSDDDWEKYSNEEDEEDTQKSKVQDNEIIMVKQTMPKRDDYLKNNNEYYSKQKKQTIERNKYFQKREDYKNYGKSSYDATNSNIKYCNRKSNSNSTYSLNSGSTQSSENPSTQKNDGKWDRAKIITNENKPKNNEQCNAQKLYAEGYNNNSKYGEKQHLKDNFGSSKDQEKYDTGKSKHFVSRQKEVIYSEKSSKSSSIEVVKTIAGNGATKNQPRRPHKKVNENGNYNSSNYNYEESYDDCNYYDYDYNNNEKISHTDYANHYDYQYGSQDKMKNQSKYSNYNTYQDSYSKEEKSQANDYFDDLYECDYEYEEKDCQKNDEYYSFNYDKMNTTGKTKNQSNSQFQQRNKQSIKKGNGTQSYKMVVVEYTQNNPKDEENKKECSSSNVNNCDKPLENETEMKLNFNLANKEASAITGKNDSSAVKFTKIPCMINKYDILPNNEYQMIYPAVQNKYSLFDYHKQGFDNLKVCSKLPFKEGEFMSYENVSDEQVVSAETNSERKSVGRLDLNSKEFIPKNFDRTHVLISDNPQEGEEKGQKSKKLPPGIPLEEVYGHIEQQIIPAFSRK